jgi:hypothetical protein
LGFNFRPYNFSSLSIGLLYISTFIGGVLGSGLSGKISDMVCRYMTRRNGGVFEPEFRLFMVLIVAFSTVLGSYFVDVVYNRIMGIWMVCTSARSMDCSDGILWCHW